MVQPAWELVPGVLGPKVTAPGTTTAVHFFGCLVANRWTLNPFAPPLCLVHYCGCLLTAHAPPPPQDENGKKPAKATEPANAFYQEHDTSEDDAEEGEGDAQENDDQDSSEGDEPGVARPLPATRRPLRAPMPKVCCPDKAAPLHPRHWRTAHTAAHPL